MDDNTYAVINKLLLQAERQAKTINDEMLIGHIGQVRRLLKTTKIKVVLEANNV